MKKLQLAIMAAALVTASSASASLSVSFLDVSPGGIVNMQVTDTGAGFGDYGPAPVFAGVYNLLVNGVPTPSFCIDVDREAVGPPGLSDYSYTTLSSAPLSPAGPMGASHAVDIEKLWAAYYGAAQSDMSGITAAALQVAIWENLGDGSLGYLVNSSDYGSYVGVSAGATAMLASLSGLTAEANLVAVVSPTGQNYVVSVPESATLVAGALLLLPFGASTLRSLRKNRTV
jgi:hypothetical protein